MNRLTYFIIPFILAYAPSSFAQQLDIGTTEDQRYGFRFNGINSNRDYAEFTFDGRSAPLTLDFQTFDIDTNKEVSVLVNDQHIGFARHTNNNGTGPVSYTHLTLPTKRIV